MILLSSADIHRVSSASGIQSYGVRALARGLLEERLCLGDGGWGGPLREGIGAQLGVVGASNALAGDAVAAVLVLELRAGRWTDGGALWTSFVSKGCGGCVDDGKRVVGLPCCPAPSSRERR